MDAELLADSFNHQSKRQHSGMAIPQLFPPFATFDNCDPQVRQSFIPLDETGLVLHQNDRMISSYSSRSGRVGEFPSSSSNTASVDDFTQMSHSVRQSDSPRDSNDSKRYKLPVQTPRARKRRLTETPSTPELDAPLSELTKNLPVPIKDTNAWVNRSIAERHAETARRLGRVPRPMNSFMLYRSAYADRTKQWFLQNNHQHVSKVSGRSWAMEPQEIRNQFDNWAKIERTNHQLAYPNYKFSPSKATAKRQRGGAADDEAFVMDDEELAGELNDDAQQYSRNVRQRLVIQPVSSMDQGMSSFESQPYYERRATETARHIRDTNVATSGLPHAQYDGADSLSSSSASWDSKNRSFETQTGVYVRSPMPMVPYDHHYDQNLRVQQMPSLQMPAVAENVPSLGKYGIPSTSPLSTSMYPSSMSSIARKPQYGQPFQSFSGLPQQQTFAASNLAHDQQHRYGQLSFAPRTVVDPMLGAGTGVENFARASSDHRQRGPIEPLTTGTSSEYDHIQTYFDMEPSLPPPWPSAGLD
jgi:hypothetical protein